MSKRLEAQITCPSCGHQQKEHLYRSIWIEEPQNLDLIVNDKINLFHCAKCNYEQQLEFSFLATNVKRGVAIWYEPYPDPQIDKDAADYARMMGPNSYYAKAPRIRYWREFKAQLLEMNATGPIPGQDVQYSKKTKTLLRGFIDSIKGRQ